MLVGGGVQHGGWPVRGEDGAQALHFAHVGGVVVRAKLRKLAPQALLQPVDGELGSVHAHQFSHALPRHLAAEF